MARARGGKEPQERAARLQRIRDVHSGQAAFLALHPASPDAGGNCFAEIRLVANEEERSNLRVVGKDLPQRGEIEPRRKPLVGEKGILEAEGLGHYLSGLQGAQQGAGKDQGNAQGKLRHGPGLAQHSGSPLFAQHPRVVVTLPFLFAQRVAVAKKIQIHHAPPWIPRLLMNSACESTCSSPSRRSGRV